MIRSPFTSKTGICFLGLTCLIAAFLASESRADDDSKPVTPDDVIEKGTVHWAAGLDEAKKISKATKRPLFVLFQEIPG